MPALTLVVVSVLTPAEALAPVPVQMQALVPLPTQVLALVVALVTVPT